MDGNGKLVDGNGGGGGNGDGLRLFCSVAAVDASVLFMVMSFCFAAVDEETWFEFIFEVPPVPVAWREFWAVGDALVLL